MKHKLILGTVQLGLDYGINNDSGKPTLEKAFNILTTAYDNGIHILDTAEAYGNSIEVIGKYHLQNPIKRFQIISKLDPRLDILPSNFISHIKKNCEVLNVDKIHGYMFHSYNSYQKNKQNFDLLIKAKQKNLISNIGISLYSNYEIEQVLCGKVKFDFIQIPFNLLDNSSKRENLLKKAKKEKIVVHTRSVYLQGLFFLDYNNLPQKLNPLRKHLIQIQNISNEKNISISDLALNYVMQKDYIDNVLVGVETPDQLMNNIESINSQKVIPHFEIDKISVLEEELLNPSNWN